MIARRLQGESGPWPRGAGPAMVRMEAREPMTGPDARLTLMVTDRRGALVLGNTPSTRTVRLESLDPDVARKLAAVLLELPPTWPAPGVGTHRMPKAGGHVVVTLEAADDAG